MPKQIKTYEISDDADGDLDSIFDYTEINHNQDQAVKYLLELEEIFDALVLNPELGKTRNEIRKGLRSFSKGEHVVFYRIMKDRIRIVRVLNASRDITLLL